MTPKTLPAPLSDLVLFELAPLYCRADVPLGAGNTVQPGTVLAKNAAGIYNPVDFAGTGGAELATAVALEATDASLAAKPCVVIERIAVLDAASLLWPAAATTPQKTAALALLASQGVLTKGAQ